MATIYVTPSFALIQNQTPLEMRSVDAAINLFITNIIGMALGHLQLAFLATCSANNTVLIAYATAWWSPLSSQGLG
ncbi:MAG: hypothetical protein ACI8VW_001507, partial [bacterium]